MEQQDELDRCEMTGCARPGTVCPDCGRSYCWQHLQTSSCVTCNKLLYETSFEDRLARFVGVGASVMLGGFLVLLLPRDTDGIVIQLAISLLIGGFILIWLGLLART